MNLQFIKYFLMLAETHNFSQAADKMNVVQSTFSAGIKKLEEQLDSKLFHRDNRNVRLTPEGEQLLGLAQDLMSSWNKIELTFNHPESKVLAVGLLKNVLIDAVLPHFNKFKAKYPGFNIQILDGSVEELKKSLQNRELDCVIAKENELADPAFKTSFLYEERLMLTISKSHELATKKSVSIQQLNNLPFIKRSSCSLYEEVYKRLRKDNININTVFSSENDEFVKGLVSSGIGCALMSKPQKVEENLAYIPLQDAEFVSNIVICWHREHAGKNLQSFLKL